ncbi:MAG: pyruvoyl-dependent arginine decarboxylase [Candidatus Aenigmarchaeota archaeon]|nr:pyruvoyl-dependent arginine decarboxylase [Candidatus Aenigmarchaeota archaeon]
MTGKTFCAGETSNEKKAQLNGPLIGCRIPKDFFTTQGKGESDITVHAGSYHLALKDAGIEMCNIMTYSSILPGIAREIERPNELAHGSVMETIMAVSTAEKGTRATAAIIFGWLYDRKTGEKFGGLVCEYNGDLPEAEAEKQLRSSIEELYFNGFSEKYELKNIKLLAESFVPKKKFGTAMVVIGFVNYVYPVLE